MEIWPHDWGAILLPHAPLAETLVRVSIIYLLLWFLFRGVLRREAGRVGMGDVLVIVLIAVSVRNGLTGPYFTVGDAVISGVVVIAWDWALNALHFHVAFVRRFLEAEPTPIIRRGRILWRNAERVLLTRDDILEQLRLQGIKRLDEVLEAYLEPNGRVSVVRVEERHRTPEERAARRERVAEETGGAVPATTEGETTSPEAEVAPGAETEEDRAARRKGERQQQALGGHELGDTDGT